MILSIIADAVVPVPPVNYGGTERIVDLMCRGLVERGHEVRLLAAAGSRDYGGGLTVHVPPGAAWASRAYRKLRFQFLLGRATRGVDAVINHGRVDYLERLYRSRIPVIHWLHNPITGREIDHVRRRRAQRDWFVAVSRSQTEDQPNPQDFRVIPNSVAVAEMPFYDRPQADSYLLYLGRITRNKGVHLAIDAAQRAGLPLVMAGNVPAEAGASDYFAQEISPRLNATCRWVGAYGAAERDALLAGARALLFPIQWREPFGIVMLEALAAGVPVIAWRMASTPEVIVHGENGFLCDSVDQMAAACSRIDRISRPHCREDVLRRFDTGMLSRRTEDLLQEVLA